MSGAMKEEEDPYANCVLVVKTAQTAAIKGAISSLKDILVESQMTFRPDGWRLADVATGIMVHMFLDASKFEHFSCRFKSIVIGVKTLQLFKLLSFIETTDMLIITIEEQDYSDGVVHFLTLRFENDRIKQCKTFKLKLIDADSEDIVIPNVNFSSIINLPSADFQKMVRYLSGLNVTRLEFNVVASELILRGKGPYATVEIRRGEMEGVMEHVAKQAAGKVIQGEFSMLHLGYIIKCTGLCPQIEIYLENNLPLIVQYNVASLGVIKFCLTPIPVAAGIR
jgi:proliferating cell nuclear antigen